MATPVWEMEGTWEEITAHAPELAGRRVRLTVLPAATRSDTSPPREPNHLMLAAMEKADEIQRGMSTTPAGDTLALIREARSGAMYDDEPAE